MVEGLPDMPEQKIITHLRSVIILDIRSARSD